MKYLLIVFIVLLCSCCTSPEFTEMQEKNKRFRLMLDSCKYVITINNEESQYFLKYKFCNNGCVEIIYPSELTAKWDTAIIGGNFGIIKK